jgi:AraC-like DNA-binding protein
VVSLSTYDVAAAGGIVHRGLPSTALSIMLALDDPVDVGWRDLPDSTRSHWSALSGLHSRPALLRYPGRPRGVWLALSPLGARALLGVPAAAVSQEINDLGAVSKTLRSLPERLSAAASTGDHLGVVQSALLAALAANDQAEAPDQAVQALRAVSGTSRVQDAADRLGYSRRRLGSIFRAEFGVTPKEYQRIARFQRSRQRLSTTRGTGTSIADIAADSGYADHAHLTREWQAMAGCAPSRWLSSETVFIANPDAAPSRPG